MTEQMLNMFQALSSIPAPREEKEEEGRESTESYLQPPNPGKTISLRWVCLGWVVVAHTFNPLGGSGWQISMSLRLATFTDNYSQQFPGQPVLQRKTLS